MLGKVAKSLFGSSNDRYVKSVMKILGKINAFEAEMQALTDEQLQQAAQQLGIQPQEMDDQEWDQVEAADAEEDAAYPDEAEPAAAAQPDYIDQLQRLADLRDKGILTDEEFDAKKKQILDQM